MRYHDDKSFHVHLDQVTTKTGLGTKEYASFIHHRRKTHCAHYGRLIPDEHGP